jgi:hypothetical protein
MLFVHFSTNFFPFGFPSLYQVWTFFSSLHWNIK